jgi:hypothetical protein
MVTRPEEPSKGEDEWPTLPQPDVALQDTTDLPIQHHSLDKYNGSDRVPSDVQGTTRDTLMPTDTSGTGITRTKKQRLDKSSEQLYGRKRTWNRVFPPKKDKN